MKDIELNKNDGDEINVENNEEVKDHNYTLNSFVFCKNSKEGRDCIFKNLLTKTYI